MKYLTKIFCFSLMQVWVLYIYLVAKECDFMFFDLIKTGTLLFFSTSIITASFHAHSQMSEYFESSEKHYSMIVFGVILVLAIAVFCSSIDISTDPQTNKKTFKIVLNATQNYLQLITATCSIMYGFILDHRVNLAISKRRNYSW